MVPSDSVEVQLNDDVDSKSEHSAWEFELKVAFVLCNLNTSTSYTSSKSEIRLSSKNGK